MFWTANTAAGRYDALIDTTKMSRPMGDREFTAKVVQIILFRDLARPGEEIPVAEVGLGVHYGATAHEAESEANREFQSWATTFRA